MNPLSTPGPGERLIINLNDHRAMIAAELAVADRCRSSNEGTALAHDLTSHIGQTTTDRELLDDIIVDRGGSLDHVKSFAAVTAERFGRFKFNGQLFGYSPLSRVVELEALIMSTHARALLWQTLTDRPRHEEFSQRIGDSLSATDDQIALLRDRHADAARVAFDDDTASSS